MKIRLGLDAGPILDKDGEESSTTIDLAARICSLAEGGEILISESVHRLAPAEGFQLRERGPVALRGYPERIRIYEVRQ
jgi:class 3 adenylate cyclase